MIIRIVKPITCTDSTKCFEDIILKTKDKVKIKYNPLKLTEQSGYYFVDHIQGKHIIYIVMYDNDGVHEVIDVREHKSNHIDIYKKYPTELHNETNCKKHMTQKPKQKELEDIL